MISRRGILLGLGACVAAPAVVRVDSLMPLRGIVFSSVPGWRRVFDMFENASVITPEMANTILAYGTTRRPHMAHVERLAAEMRAGRWVRNSSQWFRIHRDGHVLDGQHRLEAIARSGVSIPAWITAYDV